MKEADLLIFDLDGTLVTSGEDICRSVTYTLSALGLPIIDHQEIIRYIGDGIRKLIERSLGEGRQDRFEEALQIFGSYYEEHMLDTTMLYPAMASVLDHFSEKKKVVVTNKRYYFAHKMLEAMNVNEYFDEIVGADSTPFIKPDARILVPLMERTGVSPGRAVFIGDGVNDILVAKNAGIISCAFLNGLGERKNLLSLKPDYVYEHPKELMDLFS